MTVFDDFSAAYDLMFPWETRWPNEAGFFSAFLAGRQARRVLDCACGTGRHAIQFARLGLASFGSDLSAEMVAVARENARKAGVEADFRVSSFTALAESFGPQGSFDVVVCLGNSLTLASTDEDVALAFEQMRAVLTPGGAVVVHVFNWDKISREGLRIMPAVCALAEGQEVVFLRVFHRRPDRIDLNIVAMTKRPGGVETRVFTARQRPVGASRLVEFARAAGFSQPVLFGGYDRRPFDPEASDQLLLWAEA